MNAEVFIGLALFALVAGLVPGPNTFMFLAALIRSDDRQAFPQLLGIGWGLFLLASMIGFGLIGVQTLSPAAYGILRAVSVAYIVLAAWWIASGRPPGQPNSAVAPDFESYYRLNSQMAEKAQALFGVIGLADLANLPRVVGRKVQNSPLTQRVLTPLFLRFSPVTSHNSIPDRLRDIDYGAS